MIFCENGQINVMGHPIKDWRSFGDLTFSEVIQNSSNIGIIKAEEYGFTLFGSYVKTRTELVDYTLVE